MDSICGKILDMGDTFCHIMGAAHWFIVLDASGNRSKDYLYEGQQLAKRMGQKLLDLRTDIKTAYKFRFSITLVSDQIVALRQLCDDESKTLPIFQANTPMSEYSLMDEALRSVEMQSDICSPNSTTQRIVLYIAQSLPNKEALKILDRWHEDLRLRGIRSTQVYFFVISKKRSTGGLSQIAKRLIEKFSKPSSLRSLLNLDPDLVEFKDVQGILGGYAVQCACRFSEDCVSINGTVVKPCHFNLVDAKEHCTTTIDEIVSPIPVHSRYPNIILPSCKRTRPPNIFSCHRTECLKDCEKKNWSPWSCDQYGHQNRFRLNNSESYSQFTESCPSSESQACTLSIATSETKTEASTTLSWTNTEAIQLTVQTSTWALVFALLILSGSIIGGIVVFALLKRRRRRRSGPPPRFASVHHKGRVRYHRDESESAASNATESQAASMRDASMSRGPSSIWGRGSVSFTNVDDPQPTKQRQYPQRPKKREKSPKIKNNDRRSSTSLKAKKSNKNENLPKSTSVQVSLREHQRPSDKRSKSSKVTNGQRKNKIG